MIIKHRLITQMLNQSELADASIVTWIISFQLQNLIWYESFLSSHFIHCWHGTFSQTKILSRSCFLTSVFSSECLSWTIRGQYSGHVIIIDQSETSITWWRGPGRSSEGCPHCCTPHTGCCREGWPCIQQALSSFSVYLWKKFQLQKGNFKSW